MSPSYQTIPPANAPKDEQRSSTPVPMMQKVVIAAMMVGTALVAGYSYGANTNPAMIDIATTTTGAAGVSFTTFPPTVPPATIPSTSVLCAGQIESTNYCDCGGDCTANPSFCACDEAQTKTCCAIPSDTVLCPGQREDDYCDCKSDCKKFPSVCACDEAQTQTCCGL